MVVDPMTGERLRRAEQKWLLAHSSEAGSSFTEDNELARAIEAEPRGRFEVGQIARGEVPFRAGQVVADTEPCPDCTKMTLCAEHYRETIPLPDYVAEFDKLWGSAKGLVRDPDDEVQTGERVRLLGETGEGTLRARGLCAVDWDDGSHTNQLHISALERVPPALPDDHIDRVWLKSAIIQGDNFGTALLVISGRAAVGYPIHRYGGIFIRDEDFDSDTDTGWSFHPDSPIQEKREP
jgi:hypothetical protein